MMEELRRRLTMLELQNRITHEQSYRLMQVAEEGYDIEIGLIGKIDGARRNIRLADAVRAGDEEAVRALVRETEEDEADLKRRLAEHMANMAKKKMAEEDA